MNHKFVTFVNNTIMANDSVRDESTLCGSDGALKYVHYTLHSNMYAQENAIFEKPFHR
jgi:hypothetical protein